MRPFAAGVVKLVNTRDLKSLGRMALPVQVRPPAPSSLQGMFCILQNPKSDSIAGLTVILQQT